VTQFAGGTTTLGCGLPIASTYARRQECLRHDYLDSSARARTAERWEMHQIGLRDRLRGFPGLAPCCQAAHDDKRVESLLAEQMRHTGAGGFALSSTVEVNVFVLWEGLDFVGKVIGLDANGALDSRGAGIVVAMAAHVDQQDFPGAH
jgi:hypothetical protein